MEPLYSSDGFRFVPSEYTRGPWSPDAQHGGPPAALVGHLIQRHENGAEMLLARTTVELLRPVPLTPLVASVRTTRPGRKVQLVEASLWTGSAAGEGTEVVRAVGLRVRRADLALPRETMHANDAFDAASTSAHGAVGLPEHGEAWPTDVERPGFSDRGFTPRPLTCDSSAANSAGSGQARCGDGCCPRWSTRLRRKALRLRSR